MKKIKSKKPGVFDVNSMFVQFWDEFELMFAVLDLLAEAFVIENPILLVGLRNHGDCRFCGDEKETPEHLLCESDAVSNIRTNLFGSSIINDGEISSLKPTQLMTFINALKLEEEL